MYLGPQPGTCWSSGWEERTVVAVALVVISGTRPVPKLMRPVADGVLDLRGGEHRVKKWVME